MAELKKAPWAITPTAYATVVEVLKGYQLSEDDREKFHMALPGEGEVSGDVDVIGNVGILAIDGPLIPKATMFSNVSGVADYQALTRDFISMSEDPNISEIVLYMDTPGGAVTGLYDFASLIANSEKPVTAYVYGMAASAGYWIASQAGQIVLAPTAQVGSIGAVMVYEKQGEDGDNTIEIVSAQSPKKRMSVETEEGKAEAQVMVNDLADVFIENVSTGRGVTKEQVLDNFGKGGMIIASKAKDLGMIDSTASFGTILAELNKEPRQEGSNGPNQMFNMTGENMSEQNTKPDEGGTLSAQEVVYANIKAIEGIGDAFVGHPQAIKDVVASVINEKKFSADEDVGSVSALVLAAVAKETAKPAQAIKADATELAGDLPAAGSIEVDDGDIEAKERKESAAGLLAAATELMPKEGK